METKMVNNLKQLGLAAHNYDASRDSFDFKAAGEGGQTPASGNLALVAVQQTRGTDGGVNMLLGDGSVRFLNDAGNFQFQDGSVRFAAEPGVDMHEIEVHTVRYENVNDSPF